MGHVFISYSHKDTKYAHGLADSLQKMGMDVWIDERLDYGSQWPHEIQKQLDSCDAFILVMSPRSFASEWVQSELQRAKRKLKPVFPLLLEGEEPWLSVESTQYYDVRDKKLPDNRFYSALRRVVSVSSTAQTYPVMPKTSNVTNSEDPTPAKANSVSLLKPVTIIALICLVGTVCAAAIASPMLANLFSGTPTQTEFSPPTETIAPIHTQAAIINPTETSTPQNNDDEIAFVSTKDGTRGLYLLDVKDKSVEPIVLDLTQDLSGGVHFKWSPDGKYLAYTAFAPKRGVYIVDVADPEPVLVYETSLILAFDWSPGSDKIVIAGAQDVGRQNGTVFVVDSNTKVFKLLTNLQVEMSGFTDSISWSPDDSEIALSAWDRDESDLNIYWITPSGDNLLNATDYENNWDGSNFVTHNLDWSPDGNSLAVMTENEITVMSRDGSSRVLYSNPKGFDTVANKIRWSPDGEKLIFDDISGTIHVLNILDESMTDLPIKGRCASWSPDGENIIFSGAGPNYNELYVTNDNGTERITTDMQVECALWRP
jgi:Tol biopolymer transport system component